MRALAHARMACERWIQHELPAFTRGTRGSDSRSRRHRGRPSPPTAGMSAQGLAFTSMFVLVNNTQFQPGPPREL